jgi:FkbM family methyltransferase
VPGDLGVKLRTIALLALMRSGHYDTLRSAHERGWLKPVEAVVSRGEVQILIGPSRKLRLSARRLPYWSAQMYGVLTGQHELMVQEALRRSLGPGGVFIDVGSHIGSISLLAAALVGPSGRVVALDAQRECVDATRVNAAINGFDQVTTVHAAAGAASGEGEVIVVADALWSRLATVGPHPLERRREQVEVVTLDDLVERVGLDRVDLIKIDVEGAELDVVAGMRRVLAELQPVVVCEMHGKNAAFIEAMRAAGYRLVNLDGPGEIEHAGENIHVLAEPMERSSSH